ncbi:hypothetical protein G6F29_002108 [Rhizopus arrhizus]|uniref:Ankyrin repeat domain-containing protein n=1 Tax=Rhizopus oryzae TaxID=64495 RepID=A0A9P6XI53_RHIOR|nr:hypothetical protein G6F21_001462 [Rhizopus arrhizus]KAG1429168.1 hypothetical protein G6F58_000185 [Rhizopus delemar]KAG0817691.1 hypothetical protein G6F20_002179 [Rhizopus arrhizus]KAG0840281.1 hypothetical protein G6F19_002123 [Rhizopus arrhizus]KAG0844218.1 hypothetical protein G6F18_002081 [Rhizopus arrhizus]
MIHKDYDKTKKPTLEQLLKLTKSQQKLLTACSDNDLTTGNAKGHAEVIKALIEWGADVNNPMGDIVGNRPLHLAVVSNNVDAVLALLEAGAKPKPEESETIISDDGLPSAIRERNQMTAPLDLATSRLNMLLKQVNTRSRDRLMNQVLKVNIKINNT